jgi:uncharacterized coiled-coil protein SlyX
MSIIQQAREKKRSLMPVMDRSRLTDTVKPTEDPKVLDLSILKSLVDKVLTHWKTKEENLEMNRKWTYVWEVELRHYLGKVNEPQWVFSIENTIEWAIDNYGAVQANGRWEVYDYEVTMESRIHTRNRTVGKRANGKAEAIEISEQIDYLVIGMQFVDLNNKRDMIYDMGRPSTRKGADFDPEMLKAIMANAPRDTVNPKTAELVAEQEERIAKQSLVLDEQNQRLAAQQDLISQMQAKQDKTNDMMSALLTELQQQREQVDKKVSRRKK